MTQIEKTMDAVLNGGARTSAAVAALTGFSIAYASSYLSQLADSGRLRRVGKRPTVYEIMSAVESTRTLQNPKGGEASPADGDTGALAQIEIVSLKGLLERPMYKDGDWFSTRLHWTRPETVGLQVLCSGEVRPEKAADALGRSPTSICHRARDTGLTLPRAWRSLILPASRVKERRIELQYPYVMNVRGEHAQLLAVNALVPRGLPSHMRADVCQEIMLAMWQGDCCLEDLQRNRSLVNQFIGGVRKANHEAGGYALSLDVPLSDGRRWYDILPDLATI